MNAPLTGSERSTDGALWAPEAVWGIGRIWSEAGFTLWASTRAERTSAGAHLRRRLAPHGIGPGSEVMVISMMSEAVQVVPMEDAVRGLGALLIPADATALDARRIMTLLEVFEIYAVLGVADATLESFAELGASVDLLARAPVVMARPGAARQLQSAGIAAYRWVSLGPTVALECPDRGGIHVDGNGWEVSSVEGEIVIRTLLDPGRGGASALAPGAWLRTGVAGAPLAGACACGSDDPRVELS